MKTLATVISYVFHPLFMLTYITAYFLFTNNYFAFFMPPARKFFLLSAVFVFSVVLPLLNMLALKKMGYIKNMQVNQSNERFIPYTSSLVLHLGLLYVLHDLALPFFFKYIIVVSIAVIAIDFLLNFFFKISAHLSGIAGSFGLICFYQFLSSTIDLKIICLCLFLCGLVGFARLYLNAHTPKQVYAGFLAGLFTSLACLFLLLYFNYQF